MVTKEVPLMKHVFRKMYRQNVATGKVEAVDVPAVKYLQEPCVIIKLKCGDENFQRDFCQSCLDEYVGDEVKALRKKLMELKGK